MWCPLSPLQVLFLERELKQKSDQAQQHIAELSSLQHELSVAREQARLDAERAKETLEEEVEKVCVCIRICVCVCVRVCMEKLGFVCYEALFVEGR